MFKVHRSFDLTTGVKNNSIAVLNHGSQVIVTYHKTIVFHHCRNSGKTILRNGSWDTVSTRAVINRALDCINSDWSLQRIKGETYLVANQGYKTKFNGYEVLQ